jgi:NaMN:DMB phosphoribosyltransferase
MFMQTESSCEPTKKTSATMTRSKAVKPIRSLGDMPEIYAARAVASGRLSPACKEVSYACCLPFLQGILQALGA